MNKRLKYTVMIFSATFFMMSCEKNEIEFNATPNSNMAYVQLHNQIPVPVGTDYNFFKVELNGVDVSRNGGDPPVNVPLNQWSALPSEGNGRGYATSTGKDTIKLYQGPNRVLKYNQAVDLQAGKQSLIFYDFNKLPLVITEPDNYPIDRVSYYTDTIAYVRFFHLMRESAGVESNLKLQYQYQYTYNPIYTEEDLLANKIPAGSKLGDAVPAANRIKSPWINMGGPLSFGEDTGWQIVPIKKESWLTQGTANVDFRIVVVQGGVVGVTMTAGDNLLICRTSRSATAVTATGFTYRPSSPIGVGRRIYHLFSGYRDDIPGMMVAPYTQK